MKKKLFSILIILAIVIGSGALIFGQVSQSDINVSKWYNEISTGSEFTLEIYQDGSFVFGAYSNSGIIMGKIENGIITGWWKNSSSECGPLNQWSGPVIYYFSEDGRTFEGKWGRCDEGKYTHSQLKTDTNRVYNTTGFYLEGDINLNN